VRRGPALLLAAALAVALATSPDARAAQVGDGAELTVTLREDALVCIHTPPPAHPDPACSIYGTPAPATEKPGPIRVINSAIVRVPAARDPEATVIAVLVRASVPFVVEPSSRGDAAEYARDYAGGVAKSLAPARVRGTPTAEIWQVNGLPLVRFAFDLDGLPPEKELMEHHVGFAVSSAAGRYTLVFSSRAADAATVDAFANDSIASIRLARRAPTASRLASYVAGFAGGTVLTIGVGVAVAIVLVRRGRRRRAAPAAATTTGTAPPAT
jgi:hypothetical protein